MSSCKIPFALTWTSFDVVDQKNNYYLGCIGKNGHRSANIVCEEADIIFTLGQRFCGQKYLWRLWKKAKIVAIDIDDQEIKSNFVKIKRGLNLSIDDFYEKILKNINFSKNLNGLKNYKFKKRPILY